MDIWHNHQEVGRMQLVPEDIHGSFRHNGGNSLWGDDSIYNSGY